jgi:hypothetical protein
MLPGLFGPAERVAQHRARSARGQQSYTPSARLAGQKTPPCARVLTTRVTPPQSPARAACRGVHCGAEGRRGRAPRAEHTERVVHPQNCDDILKFYLTTHKFKREEGRTTPQGTPNLPILLFVLLQGVRCRHPSQRRKGVNARSCLSPAPVAVRKGLWQL